MKVFADTYYFLALLGKDVDTHSRALAATRGRRDRIVTTVWVLAEVANFLSSQRTRQAFGRLWESLSEDADVAIIGDDRELFESGIRMYREREDKDWSLTDCISFLVMEREEIRDALTADHHFEQAGFHALLK